MSVQLLDKTRKINKLLHNNHSLRVEFSDICDVLSGILESNILVISKKGKVLGTGFYTGVDVIDELIYDKVGGFADLNLSAEYKVHKNFSIFALGNNVLNTQYQTYKGYKVLGAQILGGVKISF